MILASEEQIRAYTELGCWGTKTLLEDFHEHAKKTPEHTALVDPRNKEALLGVAPERVAYAELARAVDGTACALAASGVGKDDIVIAQLPNCWELAMLYLAVARTGATLSPIPFQQDAHSAHTIHRIVEYREYACSLEFLDLLPPAEEAERDRLPRARAQLFEECQNLFRGATPAATVTLDLVQELSRQIGTLEAEHLTHIPEDDREPLDVPLKPASDQAGHRPLCLTETSSRG